MPDLKAIYRAETAEAAAAGLDALRPNGASDTRPSARRGGEPGGMWCRCSPSRRRSAKMIYTTNAVESLNRSLRKIIKTRGSFRPTRRR